MNDLIRFETPDPEKVKEGLQKIQQYQKVVQETLIKDLDYGIIPGTSKPTLFKPGAEKLAKLHGLADEYEIIAKIEDWEMGFFFYNIKCKLRHLASGIIISEGIGSCNSKEQKYRYRWVKKKEVPPQYILEELPQRVKKGEYGDYTVYKIENDDIYTDVNTIEKMAKKRAMIDAVLSACRLSAVFTQDMEDIAIEAEEPKPDIQPPKAKKEEHLFQSNDSGEFLTEPQLKAINVMLSKLGVQGDDNRHGYVSNILGERITSFKRMTKKQATQVIGYLNDKLTEERE